MNLLFVSNLFPNHREATRGMHNAQQVAALARLCRVQVIAPTATAIADENRDGVTVTHPRFFHVPVLSRPFNGWLFARAIDATVRAATFDVALVNWAYPDAYGVMLVAEKLKFPFATTVQGSDVHAFFKNPRRKRQVLGALRASRAVFTRSRSLEHLLATEGIAAQTVYNGIDREKFHPRDRAACCRQLGLPADRRRILFVGNLLPVKGPTVLAAAYQQLKGLDVDLIFVGDGPEAARVAKVGQASCSDRSRESFSDLSVRHGRDRQDACPTLFLIGARPHDEIPVWMNACDLLCLPSLNEGMPNVALEALACGAPVVASRVGGVPEIIQEEANGLTVPPRNAPALAAALRTALTSRWDRTRICASVAAFDWDVNARTVHAVLEQLGRRQDKSAGGDFATTA